MENTAIKVQVNKRTYAIIRDIQENLRKKEGKKTSLAEIMLRLAQKGIESLQNEQNFYENTQNFNDSAQFEEGFAQNNSDITPAKRENSLIISSNESKLQYELNVRQEYLADREAEIRDLEIELYDEREKLIEKNRELLKQEEQLLRKQYRMKYETLESDLLKKVDTHMNNFGYTKQANTESISNFNTDEIMSSLNKHLNETNKEISTVIKDLSSLNNKINNNEILRFLERLDDNDNRIIQYLQMSNQKSPLQKLEPLLPAVLSGFVTFLMNNKNNINTKELANEIKALLENGSEES